MFKKEFSCNFLNFGNGSRFSSKYKDRGPFFLLFWLPVHRGLRKGLAVGPRGALSIVPQKCFRGNTSMHAYCLDERLQLV